MKNSKKQTRNGLNRRDFVKYALGSTTFLASSNIRAITSDGKKDEPKNPPRPNVLILHTDQQDCWTISSYGGTLVETPHIDMLAREGARFTNFFTNSAVCTPSRGCFLTGRYPHAHGAYKNQAPLHKDEITFAEILRQKGYDTGYAGKWHLDGNPRPGWVAPEDSHGFTDCRYMFNRGHWKKIVDVEGRHPKVFNYRIYGDEHSYTSDWLTEKAIEFIKRPRNKPFCYMVSFPDPHQPYKARQPYDTRYAPGDMPIPSSFKDEHLPAWLKRQIANPQRLRRAKAYYCGAVKLIDDCVKRLLNTLRQQGILDNTIIIYTTDHGDYMGEHGLMGKNNLYETAYRIPLLMRWPKRIPGGLVIDNIVSSVDFQPTLLGLMGIDTCRREHGRNGSALLLGKKIDWEDISYLHHSSLERAGIFTPQFELAYVHNSEPIFFDRINDPEQMHNLYHEPRYQKPLKKLTEKIIEHNIQFESPAAEWLKKLPGVSG